MSKSVAKDVHYNKTHRTLPVVSEAEWREARVKLLQKEVDLARAQDELLRLRQQLPATKVEKEYVFTDTDGHAVKLSDLFHPGNQDLGVYHMMIEAGATKACAVCSGYVTGLNGVLPLLNERMSIVVVARAPWKVLAAMKKEKGWDKIRIVSSADNSFNHDFGVEGTDHKVRGKGKMFVLTLSDRPTTLAKDGIQWNKSLVGLC
jgi:predicted dithiol-disulfide oxidoreductase (DUF899 family)